MKAQDNHITELVFRPDYLPVNLITKFYGISRAYLYQLKYQRKISHYELGSRTFIKVSELEDLIQRGMKK